tara:strand:- start:809 stop:1201 length:393 start_codon:yes stop_codon:yes gene_type:complete
MTVIEENKKLVADLEAANALSVEAAAKNEELNAKVNELTEANTTAEAKIVAMQDLHAEELEAEKAKVDEIASNKALEIVAQQGAEPAEETDVKPVEKTEAQLMEEYYALNKTNPKEATRFYRSNVLPILK